MSDRAEYYRKYRQENRERINAQHREYCARNPAKRAEALRKRRGRPEAMERTRQRNREYYAAHREAERARCRARYRAKTAGKKGLDPIGSAKRLVEKAEKMIGKGYSGPLTPGGF